MNEPARKKYNPLPPEKRLKSYRPPSGEPGHDGEKPEYIPPRDFAGAGKRKLDGQLNVNVDRATWLFQHKHIDERQYEAAQRLQYDWERSQISPTASNVLVGNGSSGGPQLPQDVKVQAMRRHGAAKAALGMCWRIVELVLHESVSVEKAVGMLRMRNRHFAMGVLWSGLNMLADHYGI